jgi:hypothetical protein
LRATLPAKHATQTQCAAHREVVLCFTGPSGVWSWPLTTCAAPYKHTFPVRHAIHTHRVVFKGGRVYIYSSTPPCKIRHMHTLRIGSYLEKKDGREQPALYGVLQWFCAVISVLHTDQSPRSSAAPSCPAPRREARSSSLAMHFL